MIFISMNAAYNIFIINLLNHPSESDNQSTSIEVNEGYQSLNIII